MNRSRVTLLLLLAALGAGIMAGTAAANVELEFFNALSGPDSITLEWKTASELDNLGFNLYRSETNSFGDAVQLNAQLIPSQVGGQPIGAYYEWPDPDVSLNVLYTYWLESVDLFGGTELHEPAQASASGGNVIPTPVPGGGGGATATPRPATPSPTTATPTTRAATPVPVATASQAGTATRTSPPPTATRPVPDQNTGAAAGASVPPNAATGGSESPAAPAVPPTPGQSAGPGAANTPAAVAAGSGTIALNASVQAPGDVLSAARPIGQSWTAPDSLSAEIGPTAGPLARSTAVKQVLTWLLVAAVVLAVGSVAAFLIARRRFD